MEGVEGHLGTLSENGEDVEGGFRRLVRLNIPSEATLERSCG
jgi:hypothetical protein